MKQLDPFPSKIERILSGNIKRRYDTTVIILTTLTQEEYIMIYRAMQQFLHQGDLLSVKKQAQN